MPPFLMLWFWAWPCLTAGLVVPFGWPATSGHAEANKRISGHL